MSDTDLKLLLSRASMMPHHCQWFIGRLWTAPNSVRPRSVEGCVNSFVLNKYSFAIFICFYFALFWKILSTLHLDTILKESFRVMEFGGIPSKLYQETHWTARFGKPWLKCLISRLCGKLLVVLAQRIRCDKTQQQMHFITIHQRNSKERNCLDPLAPLYQSYIPIHRHLSISHSYESSDMTRVSPLVNGFLLR